MNKSCNTQYEIYHNRYEGSWSLVYYWINDDPFFNIKAWKTDWIIWFKFFYMNRIISILDLESET